MKNVLFRFGITCLLFGLASMAYAQDKEAKLHTYVMEHPYDVQKILPPEGKKVKNVILVSYLKSSTMH